MTGCLAAAGMAAAEAQPRPGQMDIRPSDQLQPFSLELVQLRKVDQGYGDIGPLSTSLRQVAFDLHTPDAFREVYQIPADADSPYAGWLARVQGNGGLVAVFQRSEYMQVKKGMAPQVPAGTRYLVGGLNLVLEAPRAMPEGWVSMRIDTRVPETNAASLEQSPLHPVTHRSEEVPPERIEQQRRQRDSELTDRISRMFEDDGFRAERVERLLASSFSR
jgi:hypothetical protein